MWIFLSKTACLNVVFSSFLFVTFNTDDLQNHKTNVKQEVELKILPTEAKHCVTGSTLFDVSNDDDSIYISLKKTIFQKVQKA